MTGSRLPMAQASPGARLGVYEPITGKSIRGRPVSPAQLVWSTTRQMVVGRPTQMVNGGYNAKKIRKAATEKLRPGLGLNGIWIHVQRSSIRWPRAPHHPAPSGRPASWRSKSGCKLVVYYKT
ncbi:hypothetical protein RF11_11716 [Thelohanellus kitauei]|uniref:Uncharacterized protein n=1 Tax=Thelohanellus kitauei TaxID=669202 RepID=A0A0C2J4M6_THEKT|nr:hypothetical protein RF11_11716 [Thelohanellus kitauei]